MKNNVKLPKFDLDTDEGEAAHEKWHDDVGHADWKDHPHDVLESVDRLLKEHGLEVRSFDTGGDNYIFDIVKKGS